MSHYAFFAISQRKGDCLVACFATCGCGLPRLVPFGSWRVSRATAEDLNPAGGELDATAAAAGSATVHSARPPRLTAAAAASADATMTALFANIKTESFDPDIGSTPAPTTLGFFNLFYQACVTGGDTYPLGRRFSNLYCQAVAPEFAAHEEEHGPMGTPNAPRPSPRPTPAPVVQPPGAGVPTYRPTPAPVVQPPGAGIPTYMPSSSPTFVPTKVPISAPTYVPTPAPITPSYKPTTAR